MPTIYCDNVGVTYLSHYPVFHTRMKHVAVDFAYVRDQVHAHQVHVTHTHASDQLADTSPSHCLNQTLLDVVPS